MQSENKGHFLEVIELLSKHDPVLREPLIKLELSKQSKTVKVQNEQNGNQRILYKWAG